jgi:hypothetical protein
MAVGRPTHLFIVCSAHPQVGKTLTARLVTEFQHANGRPVVAFDLGSDEPALAEFLPELATPASIADLSGQMALFEQLASDDGAPKVLDVGHRALAPLFTIMRDIDFAGEAERRAIRPIVLFVTAPDEYSSQAYGILRAQFPSFGIVPVANEHVMQGEDVRELCPSSIAGVASLQLPVLSADLQALIAQRPCSFADLHRSAQQELAPELWAEFEDSLRQCFLQLRELDVALLMHDLNSSFGRR